MSAAWAQRRTPQVGMQHHARGIDHRPQGRPLPSRQGLFHARFQRNRRARPGQQGGPLLIYRAADLGYHQLPRKARHQPGREAAEHFVDGGKIAQRTAVGHAFDGTRAAGRPARDTPGPGDHR